MVQGEAGRLGIEITGFASTDEVCESSDLMEQEAVFLGRLQEASRWWVARDNHIFLGTAELMIGARPATAQEP